MAKRSDIERITKALIDAGWAHCDDPEFAEFLPVSVEDVVERVLDLAVSRGEMPKEHIPDVLGQ